MGRFTTEAQRHRGHGGKYVKKKRISDNLLGNHYSTSQFNFSNLGDLRALW
jgi:hypothetical protein